MGKKTMSNNEGYSDPTAYYGMMNVIKEEKELEKTVRNLMYVIKFILSLAGFELVDRIKIKHKKTGKIFK